MTLSLWACQSCHSLQGFNADLTCTACAGPLAFATVEDPSSAEVMSSFLKDMAAHLRDAAIALEHAALRLQWDGRGKWATEAHMAAERAKMTAAELIGSE
jgi:hypothetical protein